MPAAAGDLALVLLREVHPVHGGQVVWILGHTSVVQLIEGAQERRYRFGLDPAELRGLNRVVREHDFLHLTIVGDMGQPDEVRPEIFIRLGSGAERTVTKKQSEYCPGFDLLRDRLVQIAQRAVKFELEYAGPYDFTWVPPDWK